MPDFEIIGRGMRAMYWHTLGDDERGAKEPSAESLKAWAAVAHMAYQAWTEPSE